MPSYAQFCPVAKTAELLCERWMPLILRELMCGSSRFGEIQRGVPTISPSLLARRLRQLESAGVLTRDAQATGPRYELTAAGWELFPLIESMGVWGQRWARSQYTQEELDPGFLMWDIRRMVNAPGLHPQKCVVEFSFRDVTPRRSTYWMVVDPDAVDLCLVDPGKEVSLRVEADLRALTQVWMGDRTMAEAIDAGAITLLGPPRLAARFVTWLGRHPRLGHVPPATTSAG